MLKLAYQIGVKMALMDQGMEKRVFYPGTAHNINLQGPDASASYDPLLQELLVQGKTEEIMRRFSTRESEVESPSDMTPSAPAGGGDLSI